MFRSSTILRELVQSLAKVIFHLKHSIKLRRMYYVEMWQHVMERRAYCLLCKLQSAQRTARTPFHDMLPHLHIIYTT
jgi:hypothetical protein